MQQRLPVPYRPLAPSFHLAKRAIQDSFAPPRELGAVKARRREPSRRRGEVSSTEVVAELSPELSSFDFELSAQRRNGLTASRRRRKAELGDCPPLCQLSLSSLSALASVESNSVHRAL